MNPIAAVFSILTTGFGLIALVGWSVGVSIFTTFGAENIPMAPSTALFFIVFGAACAWIQIERKSNRWVVLSVLICTIFSFVLLFSSSTKIYSVAEHLWFPILGSLNGVPIGHMSPLTAFLFVIAGFSFLLHDVSDKHRKFSMASFLFSSFLLANSLVLLIGYFVGGPLLYGNSMIPPALTTSLAFFTLGITLIASSIGLIRSDIRHFDAAGKRAAYTLGLVFVLMTIGIVTIGCLLFRTYQERVYEGVKNELSAIAELKVNDLIDWRKERLNDASFFYNNANLSERFGQLIDAPDDAALLSRLRTWIGKLLDHDQYLRILLIDSQSRLRISAPPSSEPLESHLIDDVSNVLRTGEIEFQDFHRETPGVSIHLSILVPIHDNRNGGRPLGALVLMINPTVSLYPSIHRWPKTERLAETLLIRKDGNDALVLNDPPDDRNVALTLHIPLTQYNLPIVRAALGWEGTMEGVNYRGVRVLANVRKVPDSPWSLVSFYDMKEIEYPLHKRFFGVMALIGVLIVGAGAITGWLWREQRIRYYKSNIHSAEKLRRRNDEFQLALEAARMGDWSWNIVTGEIQWSDQCKKLYGLPFETNVDYDTFLNAVHPDDRDRVVDALNRSVQNKIPYSLEKRAVWPDGSIHWNFSLAQVICAEAGEPVRMAGMTYDITERKQLEITLGQAESTLRTIFENAFDGILVADAQSGDLVMGNESFCRMIGYNRDELLSLNVKDIHPKECLPYIMDRFKRKMSLSSDIPVLRKNGSIFYVDISASVIHLEERICLVGIFRDITERRQTEEQLRASEERYRRTLDNMMESAQIIGFDWRYLYLNDSAVRYSRQTREELMGRTILERYPGIEATELFSIMRKSMEKRVPNFIECEFTFPDGERGWFQTSVQPVDEGVFILSLDITERKQAENALRISEEKYRELVQNANCIILRWNRDGRITFLNEFGQAFFGYREEEILGKHVLETILSRSDETGRNQIDMIKDMFEQPDLYEKNVNQNICKDRKAVWVAWTNRAIKDENGCVGEMFSVGLDITERKMMEAEMDRLFSAIEQSFETIVITDMQGNIQYVNPAFEKITGYTREEAMGRNPNILKSGQHDDAFYDEMWRNLSVGNVWEGRMVNRKKNGDFYTEDAVISPVRDGDGNIVSYVAVKHDVTEHLKTQEEKEKLQAQFLQAQKLEAVGRLAGGVAHDFNNIIMAIRGYSDLVLQSLPNDERLRKDVTEIKNAADRAALLTRQLLAFARKETVQPIVLDLNEAVSNLSKMLMRLIGEDIELVWKPNQDNCPIKIDPSQIDQILANLAVNARDAISGVGKLVIETFITEFDESYCENNVGFVPGKFACLAVSDNGCGMDKDTIDNIFEPFFTTKGTGKGTGLGLSTVFGIVKQNEGFINVYSEVGEGTTFRIYLPLVEIETIPRRETRKEKAQRKGAETVLIVDDDLSILNIGKRMLDGLGYKVHTANTPKDAIRLLEEPNDIQLIFTDVIMPEMTGKALFDKLALIKPSLKCLYMSGYTADVIAKRGLLEDHVHFIPKPFTEDEIAVKIREILDEN